MQLSRGSIHYNPSGTVCRVVTRVANGRVYYINMLCRFGKVVKTLGGRNSRVKSFHSWRFKGHTPIRPRGSFAD